MKGYLLTSEQAKFLRKKVFKNRLFFHPVQDINGDFFVFLSDIEKKQVRKADRFSFILDCPLVKFVPFKENINIE